ncbi:response regulator transcription factor [Paenibacillus pinihumi]|uniref:response regulator transcription factor n=1 Tax=Paenibacillus pinihumi TaxID=669462 RepID=UPI000404ABAD|nr:response regulator [Paenibacillus pinihumi]
MNINAIIVDDEQWNREIIKTFGNWEQNEIHLAGEAEDGEEAIRLIESGNVHIVIMDMNMPGVDGIGLLKYLNDHHPEIRIIVISGYDDYMYTRQAIRCKADEYLLKPVDPQELSQVLLQCRDRAAETLQNHPAAGTGLRLELLQALQAAKPALSAHYNDLNAAGVQDSLRELEEQLAELDVDKPALPRIGQELTLLLEELMEGNSQEDTGELETSVYKGVVSASELIRHLTEQYLSALEHLVLQRKNKNRLNLEEIKHFVDQHYTENLKVETLAKSFFVSKEYLSKVFKQEFGMNLTDYMTKLRMDRARHLLLHDHLAIKSVAELCGYEELGYFYRVFKKQFGLAPGEMRRGEV